MKYILLILFSFQITYAQDSSFLREPNEAPKEPPFLNEEEWEEEDPDAQPVAKEQEKYQYEVIEETKDYYKVRHPMAKKGLLRIKADGTYIYKRDRSEIKSYTGIKFGSQTFTNLSNSQTNATFEDVYSKTLSVYIDQERPMFKFSTNLKLNYGMNLVYASGSGYNKADKKKNELESYKLLMLPLHTGFTYHIQYWGETQWMIPYFGAGVDLYLIYERRNDGEAISTYTYGAHANGGIRFLIDRWMNDLHELDDDYGINHVWLSLDFKKIIGGEKDTIDISSDVATIGFGLDI